MSENDPIPSDPTPEPEPSPEPEPDPSGQEPEDAPLGPAGQKALAAEKERRKAEAARRRELEARLAELEAKYGDATERERREIERAALDRANDRIRKAEVKAAAAGKLADPADALLFLRLDQIEVGDDGEVDGEEIAAQIDALLRERPYLAARPPARFQGGVDQGPRKAATPSLDEQIAAAEQAGNHALAISLKRRRYASQSQ